jgi:hypothetical protein
MLIAVKTLYIGDENWDNGVAVNCTEGGDCLNLSGVSAILDGMFRKLYIYKNLSYNTEGELRIHQSFKLTFLALCKADGRGCLRKENVMEREVLVIAEPLLNTRHTRVLET